MEVDVESVAEAIAEAAAKVVNESKVLSSCTVDPPMDYDRVDLFFTRRSGDVTLVYIQALDDNTYEVRFNDDDPIYYDTYEGLCDYIDLFIFQIMNHHSKNDPYTTFRYMIPHFPTVDLPVKRLLSDRCYKRFTDAVDYFFN